MAFFAVFILLTFLLSACNGDLIDWLTASEYDYGIVIDLGTSGSRVHVFCWPNSSITPYADVKYAPPNDPLNPWYMKIKPGVSDADTPSSAGESLKRLLDFAASKIPSADVQERTGLFIKGTEGLRATGDATATLILESIYEYASRNYRFAIQRTHVALISGIQEGVFGWIAVNKLLGRFDKETIYDTTGVLDMGQGSTQITFVPDANVNVPNSYNYTFIYKHREYKLYSHSFAGYGYTAALYTVNLTIAKATATRQTQSPCFFGGYTQNLPIGNGNTKIVRGSGDWTLCSSFTKSFISKSLPCHYDQCSFNGQFQPPLRGEFHALSNFRDVTKILGLTTRNTISTIIEEGEKFCSITWEDVLLEFPDEERLELAGFCFGANYVSNLLTHGYGMDPSFSITTEKSIGELPASWAYGLMIHELQLKHA